MAEVSGTCSQMGIFPPLFSDHVGYWTTVRCSARGIRAVGSGFQQLAWLNEDVCVAATGMSEGSEWWQASRV